MLAEVNARKANQGANRQQQRKGPGVQQSDYAGQGADGGGVGAGKRGVILHKLTENVDVRQFDVRAHSFKNEFNALGGQLSKKHRAQYVGAGHRGNEKHKVKADTDY